MWFLFIDLVKAYGTINFEVIQIALSKFGISEGLRSKIKRVYDNFKVVLKIGKQKIKIDYGCVIKGLHYAMHFGIVILKFLL